MGRRDSGRWGEGAASEAGAGGSRTYAEPHNPAWIDVPARGRGRGAGEVDSWKPREGQGSGGAMSEWRSGAGGDATGGSSSWRSNDRWGSGAATGGACRLL